MLIPTIKVAGWALEVVCNCPGYLDQHTSFYICYFFLVITVTFLVFMKIIRKFGMTNVAATVGQDIDAKRPTVKKATHHRVPRFMVGGCFLFRQI